MTSITSIVLLVCACHARRIHETDESLLLHDDLAEEQEQTAQQQQVEQHVEARARTCSDPLKWGEGCDLDCPKDCPHVTGCDFLGNCIPPPNCKHQKHVEHDQETRERETVNDRGQCQACQRGFHGYYCENACPSNCKDDKCTRAGRCLECKKGFFGEKCDQSCPSACPKCVFSDNLVKDANSGQFLPAGSCPEQCKKNAWGPGCNQACPSTCSGSRKPSCAKESGHCFDCKSGYFGEACDKTCGANCEAGKCDRISGKCKGGCKAGFHGEMCDKPCGEGCFGACNRDDGACSTCKPGWWGNFCELKAPEGSTGDVDKRTGEPKDCAATLFPVKEGQAWRCTPCPSNCVDNQCNSKGYCTRGCQIGFFGKDCEKGCPGNCIGACDATATGLTDGHCTECKAGFTNKHCTAQCDSSCETCSQHGAASCKKCREDEPSELVAAVWGGKKCECIAGASRGSDNKCHCDDPPSDKHMMRARFENIKGTKLCRFVCDHGYHEILGKRDSTCMSAQEQAAVIRAVPEGKGPESLPQDDCKDGERKVGAKCIRDDFINYILTGTP